jgi:hypothetical protein
MQHQERRHLGINGDLWLELPMPEGDPMYLSVFGTWTFAALAGRPVAT